MDLVILIIGIMIGWPLGAMFIIGMILVHFHDKLRWTARFCPYLRYRYGKGGWKEHQRNKHALDSIIDSLSDNQHRQMDIPAKTEEEDNI